ncbi:MAG: hypothetical protein WKF87_06860 [Chryseolinea sp.]
MAETTPTSKFPSQFVSREVKTTEKYCKQYAEAFHTEAGHAPTSQALTRDNKTYLRMRQYARGEQSQLQYKELMGLKKAAGADPNTSYRNLNFEILKVAPKIRNVVVNKVINQPLNMSARAIDPQSLSEVRTYKSKLLEFIVNKDQIEQFERLTKIGLERPVAEGEMPPASVGEIDPYVEMNPKDRTTLEVLDFIEQNFSENDWDQLKKEIAGDLVDLGVGGTRQFIDVDNKIKFRRIFPENCVVNKCIYPDFRDMIRFGEYIELTVSELKRKSRNKWDEATYKDIASKIAGEGGKYSGVYSSYLESNGYSYSYDHEKVKVFEILWKSTDSDVHIEYTNEAGNRRVKPEAHNYLPFRGDKSVNGGRGMTDVQYAEFNGGKKKILRTERNNIYQCTWIVGTDYIYDNGQLKNSLVPTTDWQESVMPVTLISTDFLSTMSLIEQPLDQVQLNYLQFQSHVAGSRPPGLAIEKNALARLGKGGQGGKKWDPKENLEMFAETGSFLYDGSDEHGNPLNMYPFKELANGLSPGAQQHFELMLQFIEVIRNLIGLNAMSEGQTPPERLGKTVAQLSFGATDNALSHITAAFKSIYERTARNVFYLLQANIQRMDPKQMGESLGSESHKYFMLNRDLPLRDMGIILEEGPDEAVREKVSGVLQMMVEQGQIPGEDAIRIEMQRNPHRQIQMLRKHRMEREEKATADQQAMIAQQGEQNTQTALSLEQEKQKALQADFEMRMQEKQMDAELKQAELDAQRAHEIMLMQLNAQVDDKAQQEKLASDYMGVLLKSKTEINKVNIKVAGDLERQRLANQKPIPKPSKK